MATIDALIAREILDSRGNPTVEVEVALDDGTMAQRLFPQGPPPGSTKQSSCVTAMLRAISARASRRPSSPSMTRSRRSFWGTRPASSD